LNNPQENTEASGIWGLAAALKYLPEKKKTKLLGIRKIRKMSWNMMMVWA